MTQVCHPLLVTVGTDHDRRWRPCAHEYFQTVFFRCLEEYLAGKWGSIL